MRLLQKNGRITFSELAQSVGRSESTVRERITAMELDGIIQGYQARVDWGRAGLPATAVIRARCDPSRLQEVAKQLAAIPNVTRALLLTGPRPVFVVLRVRDNQHVNSLLRQQIASGNLTDVEAEVALDILVDQRPPTVQDGFPGVPDLVATPPASIARNGFDRRA